MNLKNIKILKKIVRKKSHRVNKKDYSFNSHVMPKNYRSHSFDDLQQVLEELSIMKKALEELRLVLERMKTILDDLKSEDNNDELHSKENNDELHSEDNNDDSSKIKNESNNLNDPKYDLLMKEHDMLEKKISILLRDIDSIYIIILIMQGKYRSMKVSKMLSTTELSIKNRRKNQVLNKITKRKIKE